MRKQFVAITALVVVGVSATAVAVWGTNKPPPTEVVVVALPQINVPAPQPQPLFVAHHLTLEERAAQFLNEGYFIVTECVNAAGPSPSTEWVLARMKVCARDLAAKEALSELSSN
jgi:hypothetical protein